MIRGIVELIVVYLIFRAISRFLGGLQEGLYGPRDGRPRDTRSASVPLARDPICGTYVVPSRALTAGSGGEMRFFCSEDCRRAYLAKRRAS